VTSGTIAANAITSDKINVNVLSAISADFGTVTAGIAKSADGKLEINLANRTIKVWTISGVLRVQLGALLMAFGLKVWDANGKFNVRCNE